MLQGMALAKYRAANTHPTKIYILYIILSHYNYNIFFLKSQINTIGRTAAKPPFGSKIAHKCGRIKKENI